MRIAGVVAEYNPFHNGHAYHIQKTKEYGADAVVAVMSGDFVQRGEASLMNKWKRAESAVRSGVDLVVELPVCFSASRANDFANGAVSLLHHMGCIDILSFGSECADVSRLILVQRALQEEDVLSRMKEHLSEGLTFAKARELALSENYGEECTNILRNPNDTLAVEYLTAANHFNDDFDICAVKRYGVMHDSSLADGSFSSASHIRNVVKNGDAFDEFVPSSVVECICSENNKGHLVFSMDALERAMLLHLRTTSPQQLSCAPDVSEGIDNRIADAAKTATNLSALYDAVKTKRYTHARIRRIVLASFLGISADDLKVPIPYIRVLAIGENGAEILKRMKDTADLPILSKMTEVSKLGENAKRMFELECRASEVYSLLTPEIQLFGSEWTTPIYKV